MSYPNKARELQANEQEFSRQRAQVVHVDGDQLV